MPKNAEIIVSPLFVGHQFGPNPSDFCPKRNSGSEERVYTTEQVLYNLTAVVALGILVKFDRVHQAGWGFVYGDF